MEYLEQTKLRLLREAIQENIAGVRGIKSKAPRRRRAMLPLWLCGLFLVPAVAYLLVPSQVVSTGNLTPPPLPGAKGMTHPPPAADPKTEAEVPTDAPRPLDRGVVPLTVRKVVIDPGHGGKQHGAISESGVSEKEITLDIALRLRRLMKQASFEVMMTRQTDQTIALEKRVAFANDQRADIFVSIHVNWVEPREIRPLETYFIGPSDDPATIKLATMENRDSGYSMSDYRRLLEKIYMDTRRDESRMLAKTINANLYGSLKPINPELENRGVKMAPFVVLVGTQMPAILVEVSSLSNENEVSLLTDADYREKIASALYNGIRAYANSLNGSGRKGS